MSFLVVLRKMRERWLGSAARGRPRVTRRPRRSKLQFELLEDRLTPSGTTFTVSLPGDAGLADPSDPTGLSGDIRYCVNSADLAANAGSTIQFSQKLVPNGVS